jgi:hypothetical protein
MLGAWKTREIVFLSNALLGNLTHYNTNDMQTRTTQATTKAKTLCALDEAEAKAL